MNIVVDTSVLMAVLINEPERNKLVSLTRGADLVAPASVHWEIGNALAAMLKRQRISTAQIQIVLAAYQQIPIRFMEVDLALALQIAAEHDLYAYDAYIIACALTSHCRLISLDRALCRAAVKALVEVVEVVI
jgi:predicted nucleic acid-binding protein